MGGGSMRPVGKHSFASLFWRYLWSRTKYMQFLHTHEWADEKGVLKIIYTLQNNELKNIYSSGI